MTLEVCVDSIQGAVAAIEAGADRLELCSNLVIGGTTPSLALFKEIRKQSNIPIHVMIRPRYGDFCYTEEELRVMEAEIVMFRECGAEGIVTGVLRTDGSLDVQAMKRLMQQAGDMRVTLHRCFDLSVDAFCCMEDAIALGVDIILTSGMENKCIDGIAMLRELNKRAAGRIVIQAGSGVNVGVIKKIYTETGITAFHMSGAVTYDSPMKYRKENVSMGVPGIDEYERRRTDAGAIRAAKEALGEVRGDVPAVAMSVTLS